MRANYHAERDHASRGFDGSRKASIGGTQEFGGTVICFDGVFAVHRRDPGDVRD